MRNWLTNLIRAAVRAEVEHHFRTLEDKTALIESHFGQIAVRVKEKQEEAKKHLPSLGQQWGARRRALEQAAENNG